MRGFQIWLQNSNLIKFDPFWTNWKEAVGSREPNWNEQTGNRHGQEGELNWTNSFKRFWTKYALLTIKMTNWTELSEFGSELARCYKTGGPIKWTDRTFETHWWLGHCNVLNWCQTISNFKQEDLWSSRIDFPGPGPNTSCWRANLNIGSILLLRSVLRTLCHHSIACDYKKKTMNDWFV